MTITLSWWTIPIILVIIPFVYGALYKESSNYGLDIMPFLVTIGCWIAAVVIVLTKLFL